MTGSVLSGRPLRALCRAGAPVAMCVALGACNSLSQIPNPFSSASKPETGWNASVTEASMMNAAREGGEVTGSTEGTCPPFTVRSEADGVVTMKATGPAAAAATADPLTAVLYRGEITKTARECVQGPGGITVKYGVSGRVLLGPQGKPGNLTLPVKVLVVDGGKKTVKTDAVKLPVTVGAGEAVGYFSLVREIVVQVAPGVAPQNYRVYVTFDRSVPGAS